MAVTDNYPAKLTEGYYRVRETWEDTASQVGAFRILANAIAKCDDNPGTYVFDNDGNAIYPEEETGTEEESGLEEETGTEDDTETGVEDGTDAGDEDTAGTENDADDGVSAVSDTADETTDDGTTDSDTEGNTSDDGDTVGDTAEDTTDGDDSAEDEGAEDSIGTDDATETDGSDDTDSDIETDVVNDTEGDTDDSDEEFPEAEEDPVAYGKLKTLMNIRVEPSLEAEILTTYAKGTIVSVLEILDTGWLKIICDAADEGYAYVSNEEGEYVYVGTSLYTVKSGDTLWKIAESQLGDGTLYKEIRTLNGLTSNTIKVGMQLILP